MSISLTFSSVADFVSFVNGVSTNPSTNTQLANIMAAITALKTEEDQEMALIDDITAALANLQSQVGAVSTDLTNFANDLAAALASNNTAAAQAALDGINNAASALAAAVAANQAPAPTGATGATAATGATGP